jgi:adenine phosphoribosyltransferase
MAPNTYHIEIGGLSRELPVVALENAPVSIAFLDILGDVELLDAAVRQILKSVPHEIDVIFGGDTVGLVVAHHTALISGLPYVVARKKRTPVMADPLSASAQSVAAATPTPFYLDRNRAELMRGRAVLIVDEVCSTGSTLKALRDLAERSGAGSITTAVICTEGDARDDVISLGHLPVWHH